MDAGKNSFNISFSPIFSQMLVDLHCPARAGNKPVEMRTGTGRSVENKERGDRQQG